MDVPTGYTTLPPQKVSQTVKNTDEWKHRSVDAICSIQMYSLSFKKSTPFDKQINYNLINGKVDYSVGFNYITDPFGLQDQFGGSPAKLRNIPIIQTKINNLLGSELKRKFKYKAICTGGRGVNQKEQKKIEYLRQFFKNDVYKELGIDPDHLPENFQDPKQIVDYFNYEYDALVEIYANSILKQVEREDNLKIKFNTGFKHVTAVAEEIYRIYKKNDKPTTRVVDPRYFWFYKSDESPFIEDSVMCKEQRQISVAEIVDEYSEYFTPEDWTTLDRLISNVQGITSVYSGISGSLIDFNYKRLIKDFANMLDVSEVAWASQKKIGWLTYFDEFDKEQKQLILDENFKLTDKQKIDSRNKIEWKWITEWWEGTRIGTTGSCIYIRIKPCEVQINGKGPYLGAIYNDLNSKATSIVDYLKPISHLYDITFYRFEDEMSKAQGKKVVMDSALLPAGMSMDKWMYNFSTSNIIWINSAQEGTEELKAKFNQFSSIDLTLSQNIQGYMIYMNKLEMLMDKITGVNPQREGEANPYGSNDLYKNATANSYTITEPYFFLHDIVKRNVLNYIVEFAKYCYKDSERDMAFLNSDLIRESIQFDPEELHMSRLGVFIADMQEDEELLTFIKENAQASIQNQMADFVDIVEALKTNSPSEAIEILKEARANKQAIEQNKIDQEKAMQNAEFEENKNERNEKYQFELLKQKNELDSKERIENVKAGASIESNTGEPTFNDIQNNNIKQKELSNKQSQQQTDNLLNQFKENNKYITELEKLRIKEKELKSKEYIATVNRNQYSPTIKKDYKKKTKK